MVQAVYGDSGRDVREDQKFSGRLLYGELLSVLLALTFLRANQPYPFTAVLTNDIVRAIVGIIGRDDDLQL